MYIFVVSFFYYIMQGVRIIELFWDNDFKFSCMEISSHVISCIIKLEFFLFYFIPSDDLKTCLVRGPYS